MTYTIRVGDHYHSRYTCVTHVDFETHEAALKAAQEIVEHSLALAYTPGMSAEALYQSYKSFSDAPSVVGPGETSVSLWEYAKARCEIIAVAPANLPIAAFDSTRIGGHYLRVLLFLVLFFVSLPVLLVLSTLAYILVSLIGVGRGYLRKAATPVDSAVTAEVVR